jgi:hypothetical protein
MRPLRAADRVRAGAAALGILLTALGCGRQAGTVEGKAVVGDAPAPGAEVQFFVKAGAERSGTPFAGARAGADGTYRIELPPGSYYVVARATLRDGERDRTHKGEYPGNPVSVPAGKAVRGVDVAMSEMSSAGFAPQEGTGVTGTVASAGRPVADAFVYAYPAGSRTVRGPSYAVFAKTDAGGRFRLRLREGAFRIVARRKGGEDETGAMAPGGESGGDEGMAVTLSAGRIEEIGTIALHAPREESRRVRAGAGGQEKAAAQIRGTVVRDDGSPGEGVHVMAYSDHRMIGRPYAISGRTGKGGAFVLFLSRPGTFHLGARTGRGGPVSPGEWTGTYDGDPAHAVTVRAGETRSDVRIRVVESW